jgi:hypothetical protein
VGVLRPRSVISRLCFTPLLNALSMSLFHEHGFPSLDEVLSFAQIPIQGGQQPISFTGNGLESKPPQFPPTFDFVTNSSKTYSLCHSPEGWGPLSPYRYDFTPCMLDTIIASVAVVFGIFLGSASAVYLRRHCPPQEVSKNWHFWAKLVCELNVSQDKS